MHLIQRNQPLKAFHALSAAVVLASYADGPSLPTIMARAFPDEEGSGFSPIVVIYSPFHGLAQLMCGTSYILGIHDGGNNSYPGSTRSHHLRGILSRNTPNGNEWCRVASSQLGQ